MFEFLYVLTIYGKFGGWVGPEGPLTVFFSIGSCIFFLRPPWEYFCRIGDLCRNAKADRMLLKLICMFSGISNSVIPRGTHKVSARQGAGGGVGRWEALPRFLYT